MLLNPTEKEQLQKAPTWLLMPLPPNAERNDQVMSAIPEYVASGKDLRPLLNPIRTTYAYPLAANLANSLLWRDLVDCVRFRPAMLLAHACEHMTRPAELRVLRRLAKSPNTRTRKLVLKRIHKLHVAEKMLTPKRPSDVHSWRSGLGVRQFGSGAFHVADDDPEVQELELPQIGTVGQLRDVLRIKSANQLGWFLQSTSGDEKPYARFTIPKRNGKQREICAPNWQLRHVQQTILHKILSNVPVHDCAHGFVPGRSIVTNAQPHVGSRLLLKFDLQEFFPTITYARVIGLFTSLGYYGRTVRFSRDDDSCNVAPTLARLCVYAWNPKEWITSYCPQGAPTSPTISNLICRGLDARCEGLAKACGGRYTRYADDLSFSFPTDDVSIGRFRWWVDQICHQEGFYVNHSKFRLMRSSRRQTVTGIVVNDCLRVPREQRRRLRAILHDAEQNGLQAAARGRAGFKSWLQGYVAYVNMVHPDEGQELMARVRDLTEEERGGDS